MTLQQTLLGMLTPKTTQGISQPKSSDSDALRAACKEFESVFIAYLMKNMRKTVPKTESLSGGLSQDVYMSMMDEQVARVVAKGPGIGLAASIYRQFSQDKNL